MAMELFISFTISLYQSGTVQGQRLTLRSEFRTVSVVPVFDHCLTDPRHFGARRSTFVYTHTGRWPTDGRLWTERAGDHLLDFRTWGRPTGHDGRTTTNTTEAFPTDGQRASQELQAGLILTLAAVFQRLFTNDGVVVVVVLLHVCGVTGNQIPV